MTTTATIRTAATAAGWTVVSDNAIAAWFTRDQDCVYVSYADSGAVDGVIVNGVDHPHNLLAVALGALKHVRTGR